MTDTIGNAIRSERLTSGEPLSSIREMSDLQDVPVATLQHALAVLAEEGLIVIRHGRTAVVAAGRAGQLAHLWADEFTVHVLIGGQLVKTVPSSLDAQDLATLKMRGASPAGPPPAAPAPAKTDALPTAR